MSQIKAIALDLDGTLTNSQKIITPRTKDALMKAQEKGVRVILASGRPVYGIVPLAEELELAKYGGFILAFNGGKVLNWQTKEEVHNQYLMAEFLPELYQSAMAGGMQILTVQGNKIAATNVDDEYVHVESNINKMELIQYDDFVHQVQHPINKCLIVGNPPQLALVEKDLQEKMKGRMEVYRSCAFFLECMPLGVDKANALKRVAEACGCTMQEMMAFGDSYNDISMIREAGIGVCMANGEDAVKAVADYVTLSNDEDGVAVALEKYLNL